MSLSGAPMIPYRRLTDPLMLPVGTSSTTTQVPAGFIPADATSFRVTNPNSFWVRLRGTNSQQSVNPSALTISATQGWLFPPGFSGTFTSQFPEYMATIAVRDGAGTGTLEISYGIGASGESVAALMAAGGATNGTVSVSNFPATQPVSGTVAVSNLPATQPISGTVSVGNFPTVQQVGDNNGSLTTDTPQLPATLGAKTSALSVSVTPATDAVYTTADKGAGAIATGQVAVTNSAAVQVVAARATRRKVTIAPTTNITYYVGNAGVTAATGFAVISGGAVTLDTTAAVFAIGNNNGTMTFVETF